MQKARRHTLLNDFHSSFKSCMIRLGPNECRKERVVYVDDAVGICFNHLFGDHLHIACQHNEVDVVFGQQLHFSLFLFHLVFFGNGEEIERNAEAFCHMLQVGMVAYNQWYFHIPFSGGVACQHVEQAMGQLGHKYGIKNIKRNKVTTLYFINQVR